MSRQSTALDMIEMMPNKGGFNRMQLELARKQSDDMDEVIESIDEIKRKTDLIGGKVDSLGEKMDMVIDQLNSAKAAQVKYSFISSLVKSKPFWGLVIFIVILILGEKAVTILQAL